MDSTGQGGTGRPAGETSPGPGGSGRRRGAVKQVRSVVRTRPWAAALFLLPALLLLGALVVYPIGYSLWRSLFDSSGSGFVGLDNYREMFTHPGTRQALQNNLVWVVVAPAVCTGLGLIFAVLTERIRWATAFKLLVFMPMAISMLAAGIIFRLVYEADPDRGVANAMLTTAHSAFTSGAPWPDARPRPDGALETSGDGSVLLPGPAAAGSPALLPLVGVKPQELADAADAAAPPPGDGRLTGTVWLDFAQGGGGEPGVIDPGEKGLAGITVQAVRDGEVVASATTAEDGTFGLPAEAAGAELRLPADNFAAAYNGVDWLGPTLVTPAIIGSYVWMWAGFAMVLIAAGLAGVDRELLEAARVDGANEWQVFRRVTVPLLAPVLAVVLVTLMINVLKVFDLVLVIAPGSVQPDANVLALQLYTVSFGTRTNQGLGSAIAVFLLLLVVPVMIFNIRRLRRERAR
ncbi:ABC transporter permease subunit [Streptomyces aidingensis]|uniref:Alpha-glucoside transport system permease protein n=1 Tax=Streptomyces aidingensis TaxID=910347 RepID=A0A1I1DXV1_9ACTN|nr:ABC transporter permease subunit [Streptomyces aidingensis]SFB79654.1 alpha-glucoside transport system permease protein [Streptomyces aidingensis]